MAMGTMQTALRHVDRLFSQGNLAAVTDDLLIDRFLTRGDHDAFAALVSRHGPKILATCRQIVNDSAAADDAFQEVFLTLARRARTIRGRRSLDGWLHRVSVRVACRALADANRRRDRESRHERSGAVSFGDPVAADEVNRAVNDELVRLPERYRRPVVLCLMEGRTQPEVAVALKVSEGAIRGRLARARALLRSRLARRGLAPAIGGVAISNIDAAVPEKLLEATLRAMARQAVAGSSSIPTKLAAAVLIAAVSLTAASFATAKAPEVLPRLEATIANQAAPEPQKLPEKPAENGEKVVFRGRVLDLQGQPVAGARLYLVSDAYSHIAPQEVVSGADGSYRLELPGSTFRKNFGTSPPQMWAAISASAPGFGPDWLNVEPEVKGGKPSIQAETVYDFHLPPGGAIVGQVVDLKGKQVKGALVRVMSILAPKDERWEPILTRLRKGDSNVLYGSSSVPGSWRMPANNTALEMIPVSSTDADGRFRIDGAGGGRLVKLNVSGPGVRPTDLQVITLDGVDEIARMIREKNPHSPEPNGAAPVGKAGDQKLPALRIFGPDFSVQVDPARTVTGTVRDAVTGKPIAGLQPWIVSGDAMDGSASGQTDANGRFQAVRTDTSPTIRLFVSFDYQGTYLNAGRRFENVGALGDVRADLLAKRGVIVTGKVFEAGTKRPIVSNPRDECGVPGKLQAGFVHYRPLSTNTSLRGTPEGFYLETYEPPYGRQPIGGDGSFEIAVPPGPGVILIEAQPGLPMMAGWGMSLSEDQGIHKLFPYSKLKARATDDGAPPSPDGDPTRIPSFGHPVSVTSYHAYRVINPSGDETRLNMELEIPRAASRLVKFVDPEGKPISDLTVLGLLPEGHASTFLQKSSEADVLALDKPREIIAATRDGRFVARETINPENNPAVIRMEPAPSIAGRVVNAANGLPIVDHVVTVTYFDPADPDSSSRQWNSRKFPLPQGENATEKDGKFRIVGLIPGLHFELGIYEVKRGNQFPNGTEARYEPSSLKDLVVKPGEARDLGKIAVTPVKR